ncbi:uncharacterized protein LOC135368962 isoform X1 [Ornithodoros turicata]|uniref:uncharacterized protein LOC135368962 isoform X1 n=1 Tax=Ornithodoros turicata TaxID=34597 RepID=UPI00313892D2
MASCNAEQKKLVEEFVKKLRRPNRTLSAGTKLSLMSPKESTDLCTRNAAEVKPECLLHSSDSDSSFHSLSPERRSDYSTCKESAASSEEEIDRSPPKNLADTSTKSLRAIVNFAPPVRQNGDNLFTAARDFVAHFAQPHFERRRMSGVYVCPTCHKAAATLESVRKLIRDEAQGRQMIMNNTNFMRVLLKLCCIDSFDVPRICTVNGDEMKSFYHSGVERSLGGTAVLVEDDAESKKYWEQFLGPAAESIQTLTYMLTNKKRSRNEYGDSCSWPEAEAASNEPKDKLVGDKKRADPLETPVCHSGDLTVVDCMDARHLWVYCGREAKENARTLNETLSQFLSRDKKEYQPSVGDLVAVVTSEGRARRALVLALALDLVDVWTLDYAEFLKVPWKTLVDMPASFKCIPPVINLCIVKYVRGAPYLNLLRECLKTVKCITTHQSHERSVHSALANKLSQIEGFEVLASLLSCPDKEMRFLAVTCLLQMCRRQAGRQRASQAGCAEKAFAQLKKLLTRSRTNGNHWAIIQEKQSLVNLLQNLFFRNEELLLDWADSDMLETLLKVQRMSSPNTSLHRDVDCCLRTFLGPLYFEYRPSSDAKLVSMTPEQLKMTERSQQGSQRSTGQPIVRESGPKNSLPAPTQAQASFVSPNRKRHYLRGTIVDFTTDGNHELRPVTNMRLASARTLSKIMCSFLNTWSPSAIYYGITHDRYVRGVCLTQEERDALRRGVDFMAGNIRPHLTTYSFSVDFVPVMRTPAEVSSGADTRLYVVQISVLGVKNTVYTMSEGACFLRSGSTTYQAKAHEVRQWIARQEEDRWLAGTAEASAAGTDGVSAGP